MYQFKALSRNHTPIRDNSTRWNSWERAIRIALIPPVRKALNDYFDEYVAEVSHLDRLSKDDWFIPEEIAGFLEQIAHTTKALEDYSTILSDALPVMDFLLEYYETHKAKFRDNSTLSLMINSGWAKLDKYYRLSDQSLTYIVAIVLTPWFRWEYIDKNWLPEWNLKAKALGNRLQTYEYSDFYKLSTSPSLLIVETSELLPRMVQKQDYK